ncbi:MHYT domain-containing protein [Leptospira ilyithenensis]|uniref:Sensor protein FixL n=1 Tax=Leptospira ilyithenensis TaxID=2484901 RepID=A0A4R9LTR8_9LEPT|nr:MHYT domain-containing protein [Leptospira ilyithenensis]TGN11080.1 PAS domain S-box protein [Leptospira ilyithenensis]
MGVLEKFFLFETNQVVFVEGSYNYWLVSLSVFIAIVASCISLYVLNQISLVHIKSSRYLLLITASLALGSAVWSMHFIGMLSFDLCTKVDYNEVWTILSILPSFVASSFALSYISKDKISFKELALGGTIVGSGIGAMHYMGMAAMDMSPKLLYDPYLFLLSLVVAITLAILALYIRFGLKDIRFQLSDPVVILISGIVMGIAISGMHYTGMAAARFVSPKGQLIQSHESDQFFLAISVSIGILLFIGSVVLTNIFIRYKDLVQNLQTSESRLRAIIETAPDAVVMINTKGVIQEFNESAEKMFGWNSNEVIGQKINMLMPNPHQTEYDNYLFNYLTTGDAKIIGTGREAHGIKKDGSLFPIRLAIGHTKLPQDDLFVGFISDITERKLIEDALKQNEERLRSFIENIPGVAYRCLVDEDWTTIFMSDAIETLAGYHASDFLQPNRIRAFSDIMHPDDKGHVANMIQNAIYTKDTFVLNYRIIHKNGNIRWVLDYGGVILDDQGNIKCLDGVILDNTDRKIIEEALIDSKEKAEMASMIKTTFLANMSHEIRTPMNAIIGFTEVLLSGELLDQQKKHLDTVRNSAKSLLRLLNDILNSAKLEKGAVELEEIDFSLIRLIDQIKSVISIEAKNKGLEFIINFDPKLGEFYKGDSLRIRQIITNLLGNAIKFTDKGFVKLSVLLDGEVLHFLIRDSGIGISKDRLEKIFDPFTQADVSMSRKYGGTGLGTTISKQLVELMHGRIWVESELGVGSIFHFTLPLTKGNVVHDKPDIEKFKLPRLKVLIVDDLYQNVELISLILSSNKHTVGVARNGKEAVKIYLSSEFDLILMDIQMPEMDGLEATQKIREYEKTNSLERVPIIALSASVFEEDKISAKNAGMDGFVTKPIETEILFREIARTLNLNLEVISEKEEQPNSAAEEYFQFQRGIKLFGSESKYLKMLEGYFEDYKSEINSSVSLYTNKQELTSLLHKLKGVSSNLGISKIMNSLTNLEKKLITDEIQLEDLNHLIKEFDDSFLNFTEHAKYQSDTKINYENKSDKVLSEGEHRLFLEALEANIFSLARGSISERQWNDLIGLISKTKHYDSIQYLEERISQFDFESTISELNSIKEIYLG